MWGWGMGIVGNNGWWERDPPPCSSAYCARMQHNAHFPPPSLTRLWKGAEAHFLLILRTPPPHTHNTEIACFVEF
jgi:hypothetical protein